MAINSKLQFGGSLGVKKITPPKAPLSWRIRNTMRWGFISGWFFYHLAWLFSWVTGIPTLRSKLQARVIKADGTIIDYGVLGYKSITDAGVAFLVDDWDDDTTDITTMNFHASGTSSAAENVTDTALGAEATTVTDRVAGTKTQPSANVLQSVGTNAFTGSAAVVEHGLFSVITESAGVLWDRTVFTVINVVNGDSIQYTYQCTISAGG